MAKIYAPFTDEQVRKLQAWQEGNTNYMFKREDGLMINLPCHPFTCCSHDGCERLAQPNEGALLPTNEGWVCPCGKYTQNWCHDFMVEVPLKEAMPIPDLTLLQQTLQMIKLANSKGFTDTISPVLIEFWMPPEEIFCNTACAAIAWWLRGKFGLIVWVQPIPIKPSDTPLNKYKYQGFLLMGAIVNNTPIPDDNTSYERVYVAALTEALATCPDK